MVILICISLVISEHFSMYLLTIYISSLEKNVYSDLPSILKSDCFVVVLGVFLLLS